MKGLKAIWWAALVAGAFIATAHAARPDPYPPTRHAAGTEVSTAVSTAQATSSFAATTNAATGITKTSATLNGHVDPNGALTFISFDYGPTTALSLNASAGYIGAPFAAADVSVEVTELTCGTTYFFRVHARHLARSDFQDGSTLSFTTNACAGGPPSVVTTAPSAISATAATLKGSVNPNGLATTAYFDYGVTTNNLNSSVTYGPVGAGSSSVLISSAVSSLACGTTYYVRVRAANSAGTTNGTPPISFTTAACAVPPPSVTTSAASAISATAATLNGLVNPNGADTTASFDYGSAANNLNFNVSIGSVGAGSSNVPVSTAVSGLLCGTTYYFRARADSAGGTRTGDPALSFSTTACAGAPTVTTGAASAITENSATFNGSVNPNGLATTVYFDYGPATGGLDNVVTYGSVGVTSGAVASPVTGLACGKAYNFRVRAQSSAGTSSGSPVGFTTGACSGNLPVISTSAPASISQTGATLKALINANGSVATAYWDYGLSPGSLNQHLAFGSVTQNLNSTQSISAPVASLVCNTTYYFRAGANNAIGTVYGNTLAFSTLACPGSAPAVTNSAASGISTTGATLNGAVNPNGSGTTAYFDYGLASNNLNVPVTYGSVGAGTSSVSISTPLSGLTCNTTYYFRARATNANGTGLGAPPLSFKTSACPLPPQAITSPAGGVTDSTAVLNAAVLPKGLPTTVYFDYGLAPGSLNQSVLYGNLVPTSDPGVAYVVSNLQCAATYYFRVRAISSAGTSLGGTLSFTTAACGPQCAAISALACGQNFNYNNSLFGSTNTVTEYTCNGVTFNFSTGPEFTYVFTPDQSQQATVVMQPQTGDLDLFVLNEPPSGACSGTNCIRYSIFGGTSAETVSFPAIAGKSYYIVVDGYSGFISQYNINLSCSAAITPPPSVTTIGASSVAPSSALVNATANPNGSETTVYFDYGIDPGNLNLSATYGSIGSGSSEVPITLELSSLACNQTYYLRARAESAAGTTPGSTVTFTTDPCGGECAVDFQLGCGGGDSWANNFPGSTNVLNEYACGNSSWGGRTGPEYSYSFTSPQSAQVKVTLSNLSDNLDLFVLNAPAGVCAGANCFVYSNVPGTTTENASFFATGGTTYDIVVDGYAGAISQYSIAVACTLNSIFGGSFEGDNSGVTNGSFENNGGEASNIFAAWTVNDQASGFGSWFALSSAIAPQSGNAISPPTDGSFAAVTDQSGPGAHVLYQDVTIPAAGAQLSFDLLLQNNAGAFYAPATLDYTVSPNQQFRVDLTTTVADPFDVGAGVVQNLYQTLPGDPALSGGYVHVVRVIPGTGFVRNLRLRFAEVDNQLYFQVGIDNIVLN